MRRFLMAVCLVSMGFAGCSGIEPPSPDKLLTHPLGTSPLHMGMTKDEVKGMWGDPDLVENVIGSDDRLTTKEHWVYYGRVRNLPINYGHLSKTVHIYFDGHNITSFKEE